MDIVSEGKGSVGRVILDSSSDTHKELSTDRGTFCLKTSLEYFFVLRCRFHDLGEGASRHTDTGTNFNLQNESAVKHERENFNS